MIVVVMGVAGSGKTTIGMLLADALDCPFVDGDSLHPAANVEKMASGIPLTDADRAPWLAAVHARLRDAAQRCEHLVVACSALKQSYRALLAAGVRITWVYLKGSQELIRPRLERRTLHFMQADMLASQLEALEEPPDAIVADISAPPREVVRRVLAELRLDARSHVFDDVDALSSGAADAVAAACGAAVHARGRCTLVLSGGSTPRTLHRLLASSYRNRIPWQHVHVFWGDERYVPADDALSNFRMARETLLAHVPCPPDNVHPMPTHLPNADLAASAYEETLRRFFAGDWPQFDLVMLGIGADGHTASLFPGSPAIEESTRWVVPVRAPTEPRSRLTLTLRVLNRSTDVYFLVAGPEKADAVRCVLAGDADPHIYPAAGIRPPDGTVTWWLDRLAAPGRLGTNAP